MSSEWIYDQPPPAPAPDAQAEPTQNGASNRGRRSRGKGRNTISRNGHDAPGGHKVSTAWTATMTPAAVGSAAAISKYYPATSIIASPEALLASLVPPPAGPVPVTGPGQTRNPVAQSPARHVATSASTPTSALIAKSTAKVIAPSGAHISLDTPEELAAWIAERKRKWPTDANIAAKRQRAQESGAAATATVDQGQQRPTASPRKKRKIDKLVDAVPGSAEAPLAADGTSDSDDDSSDSDDSDSDSSDSSSLSGDSLSDGEIGEPEEQPVTAAHAPAPAPPRSLCKYFLQGRCRRGAACHFSHDGHEKAKQEAVMKGRRQRQQEQRQAAKQDAYKWRTRKPLIQLLMEREIAAEEAQKAKEAEAEAASATQGNGV